MFEKAAQMKLRFPYKGAVSVEDLWDLSVKELDSIYKSLNAKLKQAKEESLLDTRTIEDKVLDLQISIVKHIVDFKLKETASREAARDKKAQKEKLMGILAKKQDSDLEGKSADEIKKMLDDLG